jgi:multiple sugar transport system substrate-binding protein
VISLALRSQTKAYKACSLAISHIIIQSFQVSSLHKDIAWEIIENMLKPEVLSPWLAEQGFLPTQITLGQGRSPYADHLRESIPFYDDMISMIPDGRSRPNIPEYQAIAEHVRQALDEVYYRIKEPKQALDDAATKSAKVLGW